MKKIIDLLIFGGQSNMQGQTESLPEVNLPITHALEYRLSINELIPLRHPVGETLCDGLLLKAHEGHGSLVPAFCKTYTTLTKRNVVAVHVARGKTNGVKERQDISAH